MAAALAPRVVDQRVLLARANRGREHLRDELAKVAATVEQVTVYDQVDSLEADPDVFAALNASAASILLVAIPSVFEAGQIIAKARTANAGLKIVARAHSDEEVAHLRSHGATEVIMGEYELAAAMLTRARSLANAPPTPATGPEPPLA